MLRSTPYITIRKANGLNIIDYTSADILESYDHTTNKAIYAARSYNTLIGVYTTDSNGNKLYFKNGYIYSTTTATKHHPRAERIAEYNGYKTVPDIKPETLYQLYKREITADQVIQEVKLREQIIQLLKSNLNYREAAYNKINIYECLKVINNSIYKTDYKEYKNGNRRSVTLYNIEFKYLTDLNFKITRHLKQYTRKAATQAGAPVIKSKDTKDYKTTIKAVIYS